MQRWTRWGRNDINWVGLNVASDNTAMPRQNLDAAGIHHAYASSTGFTHKNEVVYDMTWIGVFFFVKVSGYHGWNKRKGMCRWGDNVNTDGDVRMK